MNIPAGGTLYAVSWSLADRPGDNFYDPAVLVVEGDTTTDDIPTMLAAKHHTGPADALRITIHECTAVAG